MKHHLLALISMGLLVSSCYSPVHDENIIEQVQSQTITTRLHLDFSTTEEPWITRALTASESDVSRIALSIFDASGSLVSNFTQYKTDDNFGTFQDLHLLPGSYTFAVVAHKATSTDEAPATITSTTSATFPGPYLLDSYSTAQSVTISANDVQDITITVPLCVTKLRLSSLDNLPADVKFARITTIPEGTTAPAASASAPIAFNPTTGLLPSATTFTRTWDVSSAVGKTLSLNFFFMANSYPQTTTVRIEALDAEGTAIASRTFTGITFNRAKQRVISSYLFSGTSSTTLTFEEWTSEDPITIE